MMPSTVLARHGALSTNLTKSRAWKWSSQQLWPRAFLPTNCHSLRGTRSLHALGASGREGRTPFVVRSMDGDHLRNVSSIASASNAPVDSLKEEKARERWTNDWTATQSKPEVTTLSAEGTALQRRFALPGGDPAAYLKESLSNGEATTEVARICLQVYCDRLKEKPRALRPQAIKNDKLGGTTLLWLWSQDMRWVAAVREDSSFLNNLVLVLVAEGLGEYVIAWMRQDLPPDVRARLGEQLVHQWRGALLRAAVKAHLLLNFESCADPSLDLFFRVLDELLQLRRSERDSQTRSPFASTSLWPAAVELSKNLSLGLYGRTSPAKYGRFAGFLKGDKRASEISHARILLCHPSRPDPAPAFGILRRQWHGKSVSEAAKALPKRPDQRLHILYLCARTSRGLRDRRQDEDADWVQSCMKGIFTDRELSHLRLLSGQQPYNVRHQLEIPSAKAAIPGPETHTKPELSIRYSSPRATH